MASPIVLELGEETGGRGFLQTVAAQSLWSTRSLLPGARPAARPIPRPRWGATRWTPVYEGPGLVEGQLQRIAAARGADGSRRVVFADGESYRVAGEGSWIERELGAGVPPPGPRTLERALGAPLALALAAHGVYLLHASAVRLPGSPAVALTAPSGGGKSTLAAAAPRRGFERLADDQLPVRLGRNRAVLPHFPQLKLARDAGYAADAPTELPFGALFELAHRSETTRPAIDRLAPGAAALALARATVAARLFDEPLLAAHFTACAEAAESLAVARLVYQTGLERLDAALDALAAFAAELGGA